MEHLAQQTLLHSTRVEVSGHHTLHQFLMHGLIRLQHQHAAIHHILILLVCAENVIADLVGAGFVVLVEEVAIAGLLGNEVHELIDVVEREGVGVEVSDAGEVGLRPEVELGELVAPSVQCVS